MPFRTFFFGLVGLVCYPLPIFMFLGIAFVISNGGNPRAYRKMAGFLLFFLAACMFMQILTEGAVFEKEIFTYYEVSAEYEPERSGRRHSLQTVCTGFWNGRDVCDCSVHYDFPGAYYPEIHV